ncbi:type IV pilus modification protein PilV [Billgrantia endophytica]|uniref:Type IV pilus modification protein PilV n=1 Tax=Billgrantia endophytica TaxID=2033802 RepID=A0A2N7U1H3_9GAMM|nr:type IV pilus modification protein PilV [Halomonas endophytica]PMR74286.1 type IV pilus modification protein PilV [Halomonas endophytica]
MTYHRQVSGFTLIEALIALLVLSIGLLGVAAMQLKALQSAHMGYQRAVVSLAAIDAQERAWQALSENDACPGSSQLAGINDDWIDEWFGGILIDAGSSLGTTGNCAYTVTVDWEEGRFSGGEENQAFVYQFRLPES